MRRLADLFREHLRDVEKNDTDAFKPVARHFILPNHSHSNMTICGLSLHRRNTESRKSLEQKCIFQLGTLSAYGINERSHSTSLLRNLCDHISTNGKAHLHSHINLQNTIILQSISSNEGLMLATPGSKPCMVAIQPLSSGLIKPHFYY